MSRLQSKHWILLGMMVGAVGAQLAGLEHGWHDAVTPGFIGGLLVQISTVVIAVFTDSPPQP